ncbi:SusC/RagA family TonB-linked outer membrane protein [Arachidicoccus sp.]|uniref:SusC/RagA family TonB-linked outer membrane protein n=1 Tax=Arachidicoccus sp. TaxID=1872624 RepID=UPI003D1D5741
MSRFFTNKSLSNFNKAMHPFQGDEFSFSRHVAKRAILRICLAISLLFLVSIKELYAQTKNVTGTVTDSTGQILAGVSVSLAGTTRGNITNDQGQYHLNAPENGTLIFSRVGFQSKSVLINQYNSSVINVVLALERNNNLNDVIVIGYGTQRKKDVTGSISQLNATEVKDMPVNNAGQQMQGKMAGVQINQNTGQPGANLSIRIRGAASINAGNNPLIVIDGFPTINGFETISPSDIESISVLKDASAAALYGSRAASGVILITTKHAKAGEQNIAFTAYTGLQTVSKRGRPDLMNAQEFAEFKKEYYEDAATYEGYTGGVPQQYQDPSQYSAKQGTDWFSVLLRNALTQDYNLSLSSGTKKLKSVVNLDYNRQNGVMLNQWAERFSGRANVSYDITDKLRFGINLDIIYRNQNITPGLGEGRNIIQQAYLTDPTVNYKNPDGTYPIGFDQPGMFNVPNWYRVLELSVNKNSNLTLITNAYASYEIANGLKYKISANVNSDYGIARSFSPSTINGGAQPGPSASADYNTGNNSTWLIENTLTYNKKIGKHNFEALAGYSTQKTNAEGSSINGSQFPSDDVQWLNVAATRLGNVSDNQYALISYFGRVNYNYNEKYILSLAYRSDGSSQFGSNNKFGSFPSISGGWIVSDEHFMKSVTAVNFLKLRASWGKVGNNNIGDYTYLSGINQSNYVFNNTLASGSQPAGIGNENLTWETTQGYDLGLDLELFNNRISFTYDYYWKKTNGLLYAINIPSQSGFSSVNSNIGRFDFWGHEFSIQSKNIVGRLNWTTSFNISFDRNLVKKLSTNNAPIGGYQLYWDDNRTAVGHPIGLFYGYINTGVYMTEQEFETEPHDATAMVGTARFKDINRDGVIDEKDRTWIGNPNPNFIYGMTNKISYEKFDLSLVVAGSVGNDIADDAFQSTENLDGVFNVRKGVAKRWRSEADPGDGIYPRTRSGTTADFRNFTSRQVFSGTYIMGKNLTLGYTFNVSKSTTFKSARIYFSAQNFFTLTKYPGMNPEIGYAGLNGLNQGRDFTAFPIAKTYALGINVNF